jgi:hypothetical protein
MGASDEIAPRGENEMSNDLGTNPEEHERSAAAARARRRRQLDATTAAVIAADEAHLRAAAENGRVPRPEPSQADRGVVRFLSRGLRAVRA